MPAKSVGQMVLYEAAVFTGVAGAGATTVFGYVVEEDSVDISFTAPAGFDIRVQGERFPLRHAIPNRGLTVTVPSAQLTEENTAMALGVTAVANVVTLGNAADPVLSPQMSVAVVGQDLDGNAVRLDIPYASASGESDSSFSQAVLAKMPVVFSAEAGGDPYWTFGDITATIAAGVLTRTQAIHSIVGQGSVADVLDSIAAPAAGTNPLIDEEKLRLYPSTIAYDITLTHLAGTLVLFGAANLLLGTTSGITAYIDLEYNHAGTLWTEINRYVPA